MSAVKEWRCIFIPQSRAKSFSGLCLRPRTWQISKRLFTLTWSLSVVFSWFGSEAKADCLWFDVRVRGELWIIQKIQAYTRLWVRVAKFYERNATVYHKHKSLNGCCKVYYYNAGELSRVLICGNYFVLFTIAELDHDAFPFSSLDEYLSSDDKVMADG